MDGILWTDMDGILWTDDMDMIMDVMLWTGVKDDILWIDVKEGILWTDVIDDFIKGKHQYGPNCRGGRETMCLGILFAFRSVLYPK
ncbi:hypothetical protein CEXT_791031 [Caerostris extrusa]|uniref:Uncharacterized protein n=1 Tax=Caerostris extrusa TaxID=172846 RepID=A0AAV4V1V5_CAEEX|nr:hypothetical protein CEXT_791031 [Caerostris extrusa]